MTWNPRRTTALHEAGHAVAALHLDIEFSSITIEETDYCHGHISGLRPPDTFRSSIGEPAAELALGHAICAAAGPAAETILWEWDYLATLDNLSEAAVGRVFSDSL
ncbi:hypothetical protein GCM10018962_23650 [Dactylosporangium matsuzakiense]|uniref:Peptidase M41 domain-containing protein n=2 Tax=Dactylosporangium matsuzakiense TaxID=53360 RepID=A0A9W6KTN5_9ACTN|nr:hypothetical protein GCM10017581_080550 [Dactylosporangium matsuzakiense]